MQLPYPRRIDQAENSSYELAWLWDSIITNHTYTSQSSFGSWSRACHLVWRQLP